MRRSTLAWIAVLGFAAPAWAVVVVMDTFTTIDGVDAFGNPSPDDGGEATGKLYKDTNTGILYELVSGTVANNTRYRVVFANKGVPILDVGQGVSYPATSDLEVVYPPAYQTFALAGRVAIYIPVLIPTE
jgi:hypothetical protein